MSRGSTWWYEPASGKLCQIEGIGPYSDLRIIAQIGDSLLIGSTELFRDGQVVRTNMPLDGYENYYWYVPFKREFSPIEALKRGETICDQVDYDPATDRILFSGTLHGKAGVFLTGREFEVVEDLTDLILRPVDKRWRCNAHFINGGLLFDLDGYVKRYRLGDSIPGKVVCQGRLLAVSHDRMRATIERIDDTFHHQCSIYDPVTETLTDLRMKGEVKDAVFSPDDRVVAFTQYTDNFDNDIDLYFLDLSTGRSSFTGVRIASNITVWLDKSLVQLSSD